MKTPEKEQVATIGEYNNYFSEGVFVELSEPLFVKKNWVPRWLWILLSEIRPSYFDMQKEEYANAKALGVGPWHTYNWNFNNSVNDPSHLKLLEPHTRWPDAGMPGGAEL